MSYSSIGSAVGYVVGSYYGYPQLGAVIGGAIGGQVDRNKMPDSRLEDTKAAKVSLGAPISLLFGHPRTGGNLIWCSEAIEAGEEGAKGGGPTTTTYVRNILIKTSEQYAGPITRIWFGGKLVYNMLATADDETIDASIEDGQVGEVINYDGGPTQMPDTTYAEAVGNENALAYRGCSTAALLRIACGPSGQLPPITVEVAGKDAGDNIGRTVKLYSNFAEADYRGSPPEGVNRGRLALTAVMAQSVRTYITNGNIIDNPLPTGVDYGHPGKGSGDRAISVFGNNASGPCRIGVAGDGITTNVIVVDDVYGYLGNSELRFCTWKGDIVFGSTVTYTGVPDHSILGQENPEALGYLGYVYVYNLDGTQLFKILIKDDIPTLNSVAMNSTRVWVFGGSTVMEFDRASISQVDTFAPPTGSGLQMFISSTGLLCCATAEEKVFTYDGAVWNELADLSDYETPLGDPQDLGTTECDHVVTGPSVYAINTHKVITDEVKVYTLWRYSGDDPHTHALYKTSFSELITLYGRQTPSVWNRFPDTSTGYRETGIGTYEVLSVTEYDGPPISGAWGEIIEEASVRYFASVRYGYPGDSGQPPGMYPSYHTALFYKHVVTFNVGDELPTYFSDVFRKRINADVYELTEPTLQEVVEALCLRADLPADRVDATELATKRVRALAVSQVGPPTSTLEMLAVVYKFFCTESGGKLVFKFFGEAPVRQLAYADLGATFGDPPANALPVNRSSEAELPSMESGRYANVDNDYQDGLESSDRLNASTQSATLSEYAIGLTPNQAKQLVVTNQQIRVASLRRFGPFSVGPENRDLEPGDSVFVPDDRGNNFQVFLQKIGFDRGVLTAEGVSEDTSAYTSDATTANTYTNSTTVRPPPETEFEILDIPLLSDDTDTPHFHVVAKPERFPWSGYSFQKSVDDVSYLELYQDDSIGVFGTCSTTLAQWVGGWVVDWKSSVTVDVGAGQLASITRAELLASRANLAMVGNELLQFQTAELVTTGVYVLSGFARYLGGTDWVGHGPNEGFVLLKPSSLETVSLNLADYGIQRYYKAVTIGRNPNTADSEAFAPELVSLKPVSPAGVRAIIRPNGDVLFRWNRRTRYQSNSLRGIVPLGEATEAYTVDIFDGPTQLGTTHNVTTPEFVYTTAMQTSDGVGSISEVIVRIRQVGAVQGYPAELTLEL